MAKMMIKHMKRVGQIGLILLWSTSAVVAFADQASTQTNGRGSMTAAMLNIAEGYWQRADAPADKPKITMKISIAQDVLTGVISNIQGVNGRPVPETCAKCSGKPKFIGLEVFKNFKQQGNVWYGTLLNPQNGKNYSAQLTVTDGGKSLRLTAKKGMFKRTRTWNRVNKPS